MGKQKPDPPIRSRRHFFVRVPPKEMPTIMSKELIEKKKRNVTNIVTLCIIVGIIFSVGGLLSLLFTSRINYDKVWVVCSIWGFFLIILSAILYFVSWKILRKSEIEFALMETESSSKKRDPRRRNRNSEEVIDHSTDIKKNVLFNILIVVYFLVGLIIGGYSYFAWMIFAILGSLHSIIISYWVISIVFSLLCFIPAYFTKRLPWMWSIITFLPSVIILYILIESGYSESEQARISYLPYPLVLGIFIGILVGMIAYWIRIEVDNRKIDESELDPKKKSGEKDGRMKGA